jgi:hypothetical protein
MDGLVSLDRHHLRHRDAADLADGAEVVAQEVDDHQVLGPVLLIGGEGGGEGGVLLGGGATAARALDRSGFGLTVAADVEEALGRGAEDGEVAEPEIGGEGGGIGAAETAVEVEGVDVEVELELVG